MWLGKAQRKMHPKNVQKPRQQQDVQSNYMYTMYVRVFFTEDVGYCCLGTVFVPIHKQCRINSALCERRHISNCAIQKVSFSPSQLHMLMLVFQCFSQMVFPTDPTRTPPVAFHQDAASGLATCGPGRGGARGLSGGQSDARFETKQGEVVSCKPDVSIRR